MFKIFLFVLLAGIVNAKRETFTVILSPGGYTMNNEPIVDYKGVELSILSDIYNVTAMFLNHDNIELMRKHQYYAAYMSIDLGAYQQLQMTLAPMRYIEEYYLVVKCNDLVHSGQVTGYIDISEGVRIAPLPTIAIIVICVVAAGIILISIAIFVVCKCFCCKKKESPYTLMDQQIS